MLARKSSTGVKRKEHFKEGTYSNKNILKSINAAKTVGSEVSYQLPNVLAMLLGTLSRMMTKTKPWPLRLQWLHDILPPYKEISDRN